MTKPAIANGTTLSNSYPQGTDWNVPLERISLVEMFDRAVEKYADRPCINFLGTRISFRELDILTDRAAKGFQEMGVKKGTKVGFYMPNTHWHPVLFFGALKAGAIVVNYSTQYTEKELEHQIKDSGTAIMVTADTPEPDTYKNVTSLIKKGLLDQGLVFNLADAMPRDKSWLPSKMRFGLPAVKIMNRLKNMFNFSVKGKVSYLKDMMDNDGIYMPVTTSPDDTAVLQYTGGTSGTPKGAELTHYNLTSNVQQVSEFIIDKPGKPASDMTIKPGESKMFAPLPFFHVFGMTTTMLTTINLGMETLMVLDPRDLETSFKMIDRTKPDFAAAVPKLVEGALQSKARSQHDISTIKGVVTGGAAMPNAVHKEIHSKCKLRVFPGWGLTETSPVLTVNPLYGETKIGSAGQPLPGVEIRVCDVSDPEKVLNIGEDGELQARGPNIMKGYWNKPEETAEVMTKDGWFRTGDIGHLDETGHVFITDRLKRMINVMGTGKKAWSSQIENAIADHPDVAECVVVAVNKGTDREAAKAFIRPHEGKTIDAEEMKTFLAQTLSKMEIPRFYEFVAEPLPVTAIGKPDWKKLEDMEAKQSSKRKTRRQRRARNNGRNAI